MHTKPGEHKSRVSMLQDEIARLQKECEALKEQQQEVAGEDEGEDDDEDGNDGQQHGRQKHKLNANAKGEIRRKSIQPPPLPPPPVAGDHEQLHELHKEIEAENEEGPEALRILDNITAALEGGIEGDGSPPAAAAATAKSYHRQNTGSGGRKRARRGQIDAAADAAEEEKVSTPRSPRGSKTRKRAGSIEQRSSSGGKHHSHHSKRSSSGGSGGGRRKRSSSSTSEDDEAWLRKKFMCLTPSKVVEVEQKVPTPIDIADWDAEEEAAEGEVPAEGGQGEGKAVPPLGNGIIVHTVGGGTTTVAEATLSSKKSSKKSSSSSPARRRSKKKRKVKAESGASPERRNLRKQRYAEVKSVLSSSVQREQMKARKGLRATHPVARADLISPYSKGAKSAKTFSMSPAEVREIYAAASADIVDELRSSRRGSFLPAGATPSMGKGRRSSIVSLDTSQAVSMRAPVRGGMRFGKSRHSPAARKPGELVSAQELDGLKRKMRASECCVVPWLWFGLVWSAPVWFALVWSGLVCLVWSGLVWFGLVWSTLLTSPPPPLSSPGAYTPKGLDFVKLFNFYDKSRNGVLVFSEFARAVLRDIPSGMRLNESQIRFVWRLIKAVAHAEGGANLASPERATVGIDEFILFLNESGEMTLVRYRALTSRNKPAPQRRASTGRLVNDDGIVKAEKNIVFLLEEEEIGTAQVNMQEFAEQAARFSGAERGGSIGSMDRVERVALRVAVPLPACMSASFLPACLTASLPGCLPACLHVSHFSLSLPRPGVWLSEHAGRPYLHINRPGKTSTIDLEEQPMGEAMLRYQMRGLRRGY